MRKYAILITIIIVTIIAGAIFWVKRDAVVPVAFQTTESGTPMAPVTEAEQVVIGNLDTPWEIAFLPDKTMLVTERSGSFLLIAGTQANVEIADVVETSEGGLLGMVIHPKFIENKKIYFYYTTRSGNSIINRVESYKFDNNQLYNKQIIVDNIPGSNNHDGGRIAFGPDGYLYIATGDAGVENNAQNTNSLSGKILRVKDDGNLPSDNPFNNKIYSYGHRNPQGLAWDANGVLWSTEHGPSGSGSGYDELNRIQKGGNYGWPIIKGDQTKAGMISPVAHSGSEETWAPAGLAFYNGSFYFAGLRGQSLYNAAINDNGSLEKISSLLVEKYGRLRAVTAGPDGYLYFSTSNRDGRGSPKPNDDKIIKIKL